MIDKNWIESTKKLRLHENYEMVGIAYTNSFFRSPREVWYDRLSTDVPSFIAAALRKLKIDYIFLNVEQLVECSTDSRKSSRISAVFNVCLGHLSMNNWALIPACCSWANLPVLPNNAHATILAEDKLSAKLFAIQAGMTTAETFAQPNGQKMFVKKPRGLGSSVGLELLDHNPTIKGSEIIVEPFVPGHDFTATFLHNPCTGDIEAVGGLLISHDSVIGYSSMWTEDKKSQGSNRETIEREFFCLEDDLIRSIKKMATNMNLRSAFRIDFRMSEYPKMKKVRLADVVFIEMNPNPTLSGSASFGRTIEAALKCANTNFPQICWETEDFDSFAIACMLDSVSAR